MATTLNASQGSPLDLLIVGAGLSGIDLAHYVNKHFPHWNWAAVDSNSDVGGTWNTFTYPGIRSDSDMATFSLPFKKWPHKATLGSGKQIKEYAREAAEESGMLSRLQLSTWVKSVNFHSDKGLWEITTLVAPEGTENSEGMARGGVATKEETIWTKRVHFAAGYYRHSEGYSAPIPELKNFRGQLIHPQRWPEGLDVTGKNVVIIGSGATAITLLPALHNLGANTTMLQRTPTYIAPLPEADLISATVGKVLPMEPGKAGHKLARGMHIARDMFQYHFCQTLPGVAKKYFWAMNRRFVSAEEIRENFTPPYGPWDQRVCKSPGGDFFKAMRDGARVVTGRIQGVEADGLQVALASGGEATLEADVVVLATGLQLQTFGAATFLVDGTEVPMTSMVAYRSMMGNRLPNLSFTIGYLNQSWTLRADMTSRYLVQLWEQMETRGDEWVAPVMPADVVADQPMLDMSSGYIQRAVESLPRQAAVDPWRMEHDYIKERRTYMDVRGRIDTTDLVFGAAAVEAVTPLAAGEGGGAALKLGG
ncbi:MAG TPA: NAD(P)/FAD-dependent oxidoreductase [Candidatus Corynebacterium gallistercoris]|uniref:NAD(P)/FAD-dependent oxidoreductase n=1 Tax=Candidatus Corynebacterium gallistercoris TaxID=2838530 RepID=A0A9D1RVW4_9CORY|nr:NAD(P)/FAD-dependent oxidoreductase [Candidatus Corynebacterium gallistercoris]